MRSQERYLLWTDANIAVLLNKVCTTKKELYSSKMFISMTVTIHNRAIHIREHKLQNVACSIFINFQNL